MEGGVLGLYPPPSQNPGILSPMYSAGSCHPLRAPRLRLQLVGFLPASAPMDITGSFEAVPYSPYLPVTPFLLQPQRGGRDLVPGVLLAPLRAHSQYPNVVPRLLLPPPPLRLP